jgi:hypothetical protein
VKKANGQILSANEVLLFLPAAAGRVYAMLEVDPVEA